MDLFSGEARRSFRRRLGRMPNPVHLLIFTCRESRRGAAARQLGLELQALSPNVHLELHDVDTNPVLAARYGIGQTPAIALLTGGVIIEDTHIRYDGLPEGTVLEALVDRIVAVGHGDFVGTEAAGRRRRQRADTVEAALRGAPERLDREPLDQGFLASDRSTRVAILAQR